MLLKFAIIVSEAPKNDVLKNRGIFINFCLFPSLKLSTK